MIDGQISIFSVFQPPFGECFHTCVHFDSHPDYKPDYYPVPGRIKRCLYHMHEHGTTGKQFWLETDEDGCIQMYCKYYELKEWS